MAPCRVSSPIEPHCPLRLAAINPLGHHNPRRALNEAAPTSPNPTPRMRVLIPLIVGCAFFMEGLDSTVLAVSIPAMAKSFAVQPLRLNLAITAYLLSLAVFIPVSG